MNHYSEELGARLQDASGGEPKAISMFFETLLKSKVFVPLRPMEGCQGIAKRELPIIGESPSQAYEFMTVVSDGNEVLPIFSREEYVKDWAMQDMAVEEELFEKLLWKIDPEVWLYLNPSQMVGKEITPWEIERLKKGREAIAELVAELSCEHDDIEIRSGGELFPELKDALRPVLEVYTNVEEAFLISVSGPGMVENTPMLAIRHKGISKKKLGTLIAELQMIVDETFGQGRDMVLVRDVDDSKDPNTAFFRDLTPFYLKQKSLASRGKFPVQEWISRCLKRRD